MGWALILIVILAVAYFVIPTIVRVTIERFSKKPDDV